METPESGDNQAPPLLRQENTVVTNVVVTHGQTHPYNNKSTKGKTNIGCIFRGKKEGKDKTYYVYNVCDHEACFKEVGSQAVSYTTGVPAMIGAMMLITGEWNKAGVYNIEEFNPDPFMEALNKWGLPWKESFNPELVD